MARNKEMQKPQYKKTQLQSQWLKNVGRSLGMTATEMIGEMMPSSIEFATSTFETVTDVYNDVRENSISGKRVLRAMDMEDQWNMGIQGLRNAMEDIKSGKIYNKERIDKLYNDDTDFNLEDFDMGDSFDLDSDDDDISPAPSTKVKINAPMINDNSQVVASINAQSDVIAKTAEASIAVSRQNAAKGMVFNQRHSEVVMRGMNSINNNLSLLVNFYTDNMSKYISASISYYETSLGHLSTTVDELKKITYTGEVAETKDYKNNWDDILLSYGGLDIKNYANMVKGNLKVAIDEDLFLSSFKSMLTDKDTLQYMLASPLSAISTKVVKSVIPAMLQSSLKQFDETMSNFFPSMLLKISGLGEKHEGNYFWEMVSKVFGVNNSTKNGIDVGNYNKGQIPFDGVTKKAITEVIPTYLKKILAAVSGQEEMTFDYEKGMYKKTSVMKKDFEDEQNKRARSGLSDVINDVKARAKAYEFADPNVQKAFQDGIDNFFTRLGKSGKFINPIHDSKEDYNDIYNFNGDAGLQRLFRSIMKSLDRSTLMKLSKGTLDSRVSLTRYFNELEKDQSLAYQVALNNGMEIDEFLEKDKDGIVSGIKAGSPFNPVDKYKLSSLDYLRRIEHILMEGITTYTHIISMDPPGDNNNYNDDGTRKFTYSNRHKNDEKRLQNQADSKAVTIKDFSEKEKIRALNKGITLVDNSYDLGEEDDITNNINTFMQINAENGEKENQKDTLMKKIGKFLPVETQEKWGSFSDTITNIITAPGRMLSGVVDKLDKTLFNMIFGTSDDNQGYSLVQGMIATFKAKMESVVNFFAEKVFNPLHEVLFGEDGWFTRFKESDMFAHMKVKFNDFTNYMFGHVNIDGVREGGLFSDTFNEIKDIFRGFGHYFTGKPYKDSKGNQYPENTNSVFSAIKDIAVDGYKATKEYIFGTDTDENGNKKSSKPVIEIAKESIINGATNFHKAIFGDDTTTLEEHKEIVEELASKVKENAPKTLAWGAIGAGAGALAGTSSLGLLGSLFLPAGPLGGAIVGMGVSLLSQSDVFMDKVFGPKGEDNNRVGGIISASTQKFFKENKNTIIGAGALGALKPMLGLGWIPSFILPGGPIGGALMGIATALTVRSNTFQELMFGKRSDVDGKLTGGLLSSFSNKMKDVFGDKDTKNILGNMAVGAGGGAALSAMVGQMGILGAMVTPFGPLGGAILGAAAGIGLSSEKWRKAIFGEIDKETGKREGGALGKLGNWMEHNVMMPMKDTFDDVKFNVYKWFGKSIAIPFREALYPIKTEIKYMIEQTNEMFAKGWGIIQKGISNTLGNYVVKPFGEFMEKHVMKPLRGFLGIALKTSLKGLQTVIATPFAMMGMAGHIAERRQERRGKKTYIKDLKQAKKDGNIGTFDYIKQRYFDRDAMEDAKTAAKVGNAKEMREEAASRGMTFSQLVNFKKKEARNNYRGNLREQYLNGELSLSDYLNSAFFDRRAMEREEDKALGTNERNEYYAKLDEDKAKFRESLAEKEEALRASKSRRKYLRDLGMDTGYTGFIYEKDENGNKVEGGTKVTVDRVIEALSMKRSTMTDDQVNIFNEIGGRLGISNLLDAYGENGLDMSNLSRGKRRKLQKGITNGNVNDLLRKLSPYTKEERTEAFNEELANLTREYGDRLSGKIDISNSALAELENTFKDAYNLLRRKYGLRTIRFKKNPNGETNVDTLLLPAPKDFGNESEAIVNKLDEVSNKISELNPAASNLLPMVVDNNSEKETEDNIKPSDNVTNSSFMAPAIIEANNKLAAREAFIDAENKKKEAIEKNQQIASRKTAQFVIGENDNKRNMKSFLKNHILQSDMLVSVNKTLGSISKGFSWVFGKKGILTGLFLFVLPMILKWLQDRSGGETPDHRLDAMGDTIDNSGINKTFNVAIGKGLNKVAQELLSSPIASKIGTIMSDKYGKWVGGLSEGILKNIGKAAGSGSSSATSSVLELLARQSGGLTDDVLKSLPFDDMGKLPTTSLVNAAKGSIDDILKLTGPSVTETVIDWAKLGKGADDTAKGFSKYFNTFKYGKTSSQVNKELAEKLGSKGIIEATQYTVKDEAGRIIYEARETGAKKVLGWMKTALDDFTTMILNGIKGIANISIGSANLTSDIISMVDQRLIMQKFGHLIGNGSKLTLEVLAKTFTDGVFMTYGAITGAFEAARLFRVYKNDVDITMSLISAAFKGAMGYKYMFLVEMLNEIIADVTDYDIFSMLATGIYKLISDNEKDLALEQAQLDFKSGMEYYNKTNGTALTVDSYNDLVNNFLSTSILDQGSAINHRIDENLGTIGRKVAKGGVKALIDGGVDGLKNYASKGLKIGSALVDKLPFGKALRSTASSASSFGKTVVKSTVEVLNEIDLDRMKTFRKLVSQAVEKINTAFSKSFPKAGKRFGGMIRNVIVTLSDDVLAKFMPKIADKLATKAMGMTAGALTAGVWTAVEFGAGAIGGATKTSAANLFRVGKSDVDWIMRSISSIINGLLNVSWFFVIDILNDIYVAMTDTDFISYLATMMYEAVAGEEKSMALDNAQIEFENRVTEYNKENGVSLSVDEYNDEVENASLWTKTKNWWQDKKEERALRKEAKDAGMTVEEYTAYKKSRLKYEDEEVADLTSIKASMDSLEEQKEAIIASTDENMYNLRKIITATMSGLNVTTFEQLAPTLDLSESQLISIRKVIENTMYGLDDETKKQMSETLGVSVESLDGIYATMEAAMLGLNETTLDKMTPIMDITEEKLEGIKWVVEQTLGGMDESTVKNMFEMGQITEEQMNDIFTIMDGTLNGMNEETLKALAPILGITEENLGAVEQLINDTMAGINGETEDKLSDLVVADPLRKAKENIEDGMAMVEEESGNWFTNMVDTVSNWWSNSWVGEKFGQAGSWISDKVSQGVGFVKELGGKGGELIGEGIETVKDLGRQGIEWGKGKLTELDQNNRNNVASHYGIEASDVTLGQRMMVGGAEYLEKMTAGLLDSGDIISTVETVKTNVFDKFTEIRDTISTNWATFSEDVGIIVEGSSILVKRAWEGTKEKINEFISPIVEYTSELWTDIKSNISTTWTDVKTGIASKWEGFTTWSSDLWEQTKSNISTTWTDVKTNVASKWDGFTTWSSDLWEQTKSNISTTWTDVKTNVASTLSSAVENAKEGLTGIKQGIVDKITSIKDNVKEHLGDPLIAGVKSAFTKIKDGILAPINWVKEKFGKGLSAVKNGWNGIVNYFQSIIDSEGGYGELDLGGKGGDNDDFINSTSKGNIINNITNNYNNIPFNGIGGYGENGYGPGAKIIPVGGGKPQPVQSVNQSGIGEGGMGIEPDTLNNFAYYAQTDDRYKNHSYNLSPGLGSTSDPSLNARGCGPTSMAMVATQLTGKKYLPTTLADMSRSWGHSVSAGTSWSFFDKAANTFSMDMGKSAPSVTKMRSAINSGQPIIISGRRSKYDKNNSPFTTGGHFVVGVGTQGNSKILINDPRGSSYSKAYDIDKVANEARQIWQFKYNAGGSLPNPDGDYSPTSTSNGNTSTVGTTSDEKLGTWGAFTKMLEAVGIYVGNVTNGTSDRLTWGDSSSSSSSSSSSENGYSSSMVPTTVQDAILKKTLELTVQHETGGNYTRVKNDTTSSGESISPSIGIIQMRGNNAKELMQNMYKKLPNSSEAKYWANWDWNSRAPWSESQRRRLENFLSSNLSVTKEVQDAHAMNYIKDRNLSQVYKYGVDAGKISDPRSIVHLGEIGNTGPAHIKTFMSSYSKNSSGDEFEHYVKQFKAKSYWGKYPIYNNRLNQSYNALKNWDAKQMLDQGGYGEADMSAMLGDIARNSEEQATLMVESLMPKCLLDDSCGGKGGDYENSTSFTADRANNMVAKLMEDVKNRNFNETPENINYPSNVLKVDFTKDGRPVDDNSMSFNPDLSDMEDLGGKGGETVNDTQSNTGDFITNEKDESAEELKTLNNNVSKMTEKIVAKTPTLISEDNRTKSTLSPQPQPTMSETLMLEIISILKGVENNTGATTDGITTLSNKDLNIENNIDIQVEKDESGNIVAVANGGTTNVNPMFKTNTVNNTDAKYVTAKSIAKGRINK